MFIVNNSNIVAHICHTCQYYNGYSPFKLLVGSWETATVCGKRIEGGDCRLIAAFSSITQELKLLETQKPRINLGLSDRYFSVLLLSLDTSAGI